MKSIEAFNQEEFSVAIPAYLYECIQAEREQGKLFFALYKSSVGIKRFTALIHEVVFPKKGEDISKYFHRISEIAGKIGSGIVLIEIGENKPSQNKDYNQTISALAPNATNLPLVIVILGTSNICYLNKVSESPKWGVNIRIVGEKLDVFHNDNLLPRPGYKEIYKRTITVWGEDNHAKLARLRVGIIGLGSVGSIVAESLARIGMERLVLMDFDEVQEHNLDRLLGATKDDIAQLKIDIAERQIKKSSTASNVCITKVLFGITEEEGYHNALDCDVLFSCVDRPWPRYVLNSLAYNHLIPVIDGGIQVRFNPETKKFEGADWQLQTVGPGKICLECLNAYYPSDVSTEREGLLENPTYLAGLPYSHEFKRNENVFPYSANLASLEVLQLIELVTGIAERYYYGIQRYSYNHGYIRITDDRNCIDGCYFQRGIGLGDSEYGVPYGYDHAANEARKRQQKANQ